MDLRANNNLAETLTNKISTPTQTRESVNRSILGSEAESTTVAYGIGSANKPEVELSPQARILQQNEKQQEARRESLQQEEDNPNALTGDEFVRVSSSVGTAQKNNLTTEKATEVYRSIQEML
ncbi:hypothetical protein OE749_02570 [Aestuariibacter sp. AA17]|uniref:Uncharacterized protein n=1 Tax=Fluctibacter corallii TaxID=2984329 RepID=A0ABT3A5P3_9ALTE|nr:hypothetical protein [Aestuariibacter sp. AA17]MCV2883582.1 hypothetical protein [Aestuariibacter sp. AA17]